MGQGDGLMNGTQAPPELSFPHFKMLDISNREYSNIESELPTLVPYFTGSFSITLDERHKPYPHRHSRQRDPLKA